MGVRLLKEMALFPSQQTDPLADNDDFVTHMTECTQGFCFRLSQAQTIQFCPGLF